jgi:hypothetical protein
MEPTKTWFRYRSGENFSERLRTQRVQIAVPVLVRGKEANRPFEEATHSVSVNAYGGVIRLLAQVALGQQISIVNPQTAKEISGMVTFVGLKNAGKRDISVEFSEPSVPFWGIRFPGWNLSDRKGHTQKP